MRCICISRCAIRLQINPINLRHINLPPNPTSFVSVSIASAFVNLLGSFFSSVKPYRFLPRLLLLLLVGASQFRSVFRRFDAASLVKRFLPKDSMYFKNIKAHPRPLSDTFVLCYVLVSISQRSSLENKLSASVFHRTRLSVRREKFVIVSSAVP